MENSQTKEPQSILITGGAGFIGVNAADYYLKRGKNVIVLDDLSRDGSGDNLEWLRSQHGDSFRFVEADISRDFDKLCPLMEEVDVVIHLAAQVAVTTSVVDPRNDFEVNALGSFNVLEAIRQSKRQPIALYSSTNKVYGGMEDVEITERNGRYEYKDMTSGASEERQLDFHSPYGCSKGTADQYFIDYARIYGLKTVVFRQSCIYGTRQFGVEDQGWVAWFTIAALLNKDLTIYGDGKQVRDVLFVEDLIRGYDAAIANIDKTSGRVYNMGGGPENQLSLLTLLDILEQELDKKIPYTFDDWRPGDQKVFVCDISKARREFGWEPQISAKEGVVKLIDWVKENSALFTEKREHKSPKAKARVKEPLHKTFAR
jgi:CDP-paratose 2-epimerase